MSDKELDRWLAEHAFGWIWMQGAGFNLPRFSSDPAASKQLRDKMREKGWAYHVSVMPSDVSACAFCAFYAPTDSSTGKGIEAETEERAVALAAKAVLEKERPE